MDVGPWTDHIYKYCRTLARGRADQDYRDLAHSVIVKLLNVDKSINDAYIHTVCLNTWRDILTVRAIDSIYISHMNVDKIVPMALMVMSEAEQVIEAKQLGFELDAWRDSNFCKRGHSLNFTGSFRNNNKGYKICLQCERNR